MDEEPLRLEYENARDRLEQQTTVLSEFANNGYRMLRVLFIVSGFIITAITATGSNLIAYILQNTACAVSFGLSCLNMNTVASIGIFSILISILCNTLAVGIESRGIGGYGTPRDIDETLESDYSTENFYQSRLSDYRNRIEDNEVVIDFLETTLALGGASILAAILCLSIISFVISTSNPIGPLTALGGVLAMIAILILMEKKLPSSYLAEERPDILRKR